MLKLGVNNCWSTPIYKTQMSTEQCNSLLQEIMTSKQAMNNQGEKVDVCLINQIPLLKEIAIEKYNDFFREAFDMELKDLKYWFRSWLTGSDSGYTMDIHNHSGAQFAAVFYIMSEDENSGGELVAYDPRVNANRGYAINDKLSEMFKPIEFTPKTGDVIIMPGFVYHSVKRYNANFRIAAPVDIFIQQDDGLD